MDSTNADREERNVLQELLKGEDATLEEKIQLLHLKNETDRLEIDKLKSKSETRFWNKNFVVILTSLISLTVAIFPLAGVWVAAIQKDKELEITRIQKQQEFTLANTRQTDSNRIEIAKFVLEQADKILSNDKRERELATSTLLKAFPNEELDGIFDTIESMATSPEVRREIQNVRANIKQKQIYKIAVPTYFSVNVSPVNDQTGKVDITSGDSGSDAVAFENAVRSAENRLGHEILGHSAEK